MSIKSIRSALALTGVLACSAPTMAGVAPAQVFTEGFDADTANWQTGIFTTPDYVASGSFDGSGYISAELDLASGGGFGLTVFRAQQDLGSSGGGFAGDYIAGGINTLTFQFRHNAPEPLAGFVRFSKPANNPAVVWGFSAIPSGEWTQVMLVLDPSLPNFIPAGGQFADVMSDVGNLQFAVTGPQGLSGLTTFDIDQVSIVPSPAGVIAFAGIALGGATRRRRMR